MEKLEEKGYLDMVEQEDDLSSLVIPDYTD
jgi:hypothetical protein